MYHIQVTEYLFTSEYLTNTVTVHSTLSFKDRKYKDSMSTKTTETYTLFKTYEICKIATMRFQNG